RRVGHLRGGLDVAGGEVAQELEGGGLRARLQPRLDELVAQLLAAGELQTPLLRERRAGAEQKYGEAAFQAAARAGSVAPAQRAQRILRCSPVRGSTFASSGGAR